VETPAEHTAWLLNAYPRREQLVNELHARPFVSASAPLRVSHLALLAGEGDGERHRQHLAALCERMGAPPPGPQAQHHRAEIGNVVLRWEQHTEFATYTVLRRGEFREPFESSALAEVPLDWLRNLPGQLLVALHLAMLSADAGELSTERLTSLFGTHRHMGATVEEGAATVWTDFRLQGDGFVRLLVQDHGLIPQQGGRLLRRLLELETYRTLALLAFPVALEARARLRELEGQLTDITRRIPELREQTAEQALLAELTGLSTATARLLEGTSYRFAAARAYHRLVSQRVAELRETRLPGVQTIGEFMARRLDPAMASCASVSGRMESLVGRINHATGLLRTVVDVGLQGQNRDLLRAINRRARLQIQLQQLVEGLSVLAFSHYALVLLGFLLGGLRSLGLAVNLDLVLGLGVLVVVPLSWWSIRRLKRRVLMPPGE